MAQRILTAVEKHVPKEGQRKHGGHVDIREHDNTEKAVVPPSTSASTKDERIQYLVGILGDYVGGRPKQRGITDSDATVWEVSTGRQHYQIRFD